MSYDEIVTYIYNIPKFTKKRTMAETKSLMDFFCNPQEKFTYIHIAGTNGKGSVSAMLEHCIRACGHKTGLFTSPHLVKINERICIDGEMISDEDFVALFNEVKAKIDDYIRQGGTHPTFFEMLYLMAMVWFEKCGIEYAIVETGLGGRLDATNVIVHPALTIITSIGFDHMQYLGTTIPEIAGEKAGIIKAGVPVIYDDINAEASKVIRAKALEMHAPAIPVSGKNRCQEELFEDGCTYIWQAFASNTVPNFALNPAQDIASKVTKNSAQDIAPNATKNPAQNNESEANHEENQESVTCQLPITLYMLGTYQLQNSAIAVMAMYQLYKDKNISFKTPYESLLKEKNAISSSLMQKFAHQRFFEAIRQGIAQTRWAGRMEKVTDNLYIDGAHNDAGIRALTDTLKKRFEDEDIYLLFAVAEDKDYTDMIKDLCTLPYLQGVVVTVLDNERRTDMNTVAKIFKENGHALVKCSYNIKEALEMAQEMAASHVLCCCGSLYLAGSIKAIIGG